MPLSTLSSAHWILVSLHGVVYTIIALGVGIIYHHHHHIQAAQFSIDVLFVTSAWIPLVRKTTHLLLLKTQKAIIIHSSSSLDHFYFRVMLVGWSIDQDQVMLVSNVIIWSINFVLIYHVS